MLYEKPKDITYTQMAIFIDENIYKENLDESTINLIFQYLYHLSYMLARKQNFFTKVHYYEDFSIYLATIVYLRLTNKKQYELKKDGTYRMEKIKSVLNYLKSILYPRKVEFEQDNYYQGLKTAPIEEQEEVVQVSSSYFYDKVDELSLCDIDCYFGDVPKTIKYFLKSIPYYNDKKIWNNIYISCLLTLMDSITLTEYDRYKISKMKYKVGPGSSYLEDLYVQNRLKDPILYQLPISMKSYIRVLCNEIRNLICNDISQMIDESISSASNSYILLEEINGFDIEEFS